LNAKKSLVINEIQNFFRMKKLSKHFKFTQIEATAEIAPQLVESVKELTKVFF